jgi:hypothetical protein
VIHVFSFGKKQWMRYGEWFEWGGSSRPGYTLSSLVWPASVETTLNEILVGSSRLGDSRYVVFTASDMSRRTSLQQAWKISYFEVKV